MRQESLTHASTVAPYALSYLLVPLLFGLAALGGWWLLLMPLATWGLFSVLDQIAGPDLDNPDPATPQAQLRWYRAIVLGWVPLQAVAIVALVLWIGPSTDHSPWEKLGIFFGLGILSGTVGITYAHELIHQRPAMERRAGLLLLGMVLYAHFRSEHLLVHHRHVATPRDPVSARAGESFYAFFPRVLWQCARSSFQAEAAMLERKGLPPLHPSNPFWVYILMQAGFLGLALGLGGWAGLGLFVFQALVAIWQLEMVNYVEHYGLRRQKLATGKYEPVRPHHSWNSDLKASNWLLINLQRHSDHHYKPDRRFPVLQTYSEDDAPQLPYGYSVMTAAALVPPLYHAMMRPRLEAWRTRFYPQITDWSEGMAG